MTAFSRGVRHESDVLLRQIDGHLATLRAAPTSRAVTRQGVPAQEDLAVAERMADALRRLIAETNRASAADRAKVRAAVHYFVSRGMRYLAQSRNASAGLGYSRRNDLRVNGNMDDDLRVVNKILGGLGSSNRNTARLLEPV